MPDSGARFGGRRAVEVLGEHHGGARLPFKQAEQQLDAAGPGEYGKKVSVDYSPSL